MKKLFFTKWKAIGIILALVSSMGFYSCGSDDEEVSVPTVLKVDYESKSIDLTIPDEKVINIIQGNSGYGVTSSNQNVAIATIDGTRVKIKAISEGTTLVTIIDEQAQKLEFTVNVQKVAVDLYVNRAAVSITEKYTTVVDIVSGNGNYTVLSTNSNIATAEVTETSITITAKAKGSATITVKDGLNKTTDIIVTVLTVEEVINNTKWGGATIDVTAETNETEQKPAKEAIEGEINNQYVELLKLATIEFKDKKFTLSMELTPLSYSIMTGNYKVEEDKVVVSDIKAAELNETISVIISATIGIDIRDIVDMIPSTIEIPIPQKDFAETSKLEISIPITLVYTPEKMQALADANQNPEIAKAEVKSVVINASVSKK